MDEGSECIISSAATPQYSELQKTCRPSGRCLLRLGRADQSEQSWLLGRGGEPNLSVQTEGEYRCNAY